MTGVQTCALPISNGYLDDLAVSLVGEFVANLQEYLMVKDLRYFNLVKESKKLAPDSEALLKEAIAKVKQDLQKA